MDALPAVIIGISPPVRVTPPWVIVIIVGVAVIIILPKIDFFAE
jgi:hypothetical protein